MFEKKSNFLDFLAKRLHRSFFYKGRVKLDGYIGKPLADKGHLKSLSGFPLHTVNCSFHPYGELSLYDMEKIFQDKFRDFSTFDGFMDFNLGLWTNDLDIYIRLFYFKDALFYAN